MKIGVKSLSRSRWLSGARRAFTLIEIMIVVGIIGVILAAGVPTLYKVLHKEGFRKTINDIIEVCNAARAQAILQGVTAEVQFHPQDGRVEVATGTAPGSGGLAHTAKIEENTTIEMLDVNLREYRHTELARVRFFPNGTCDEMTLILRSDKGEQRGIVLEITTGLASALNEQDLWELRTGKR
jgi:prepilin-type N-terminal cleavage/methylation domain-containing protein